MKRKHRKKLMKLTALLLAVIICLDASTLYGIGWLASNITAYADEIIDGALSKFNSLGSAGNVVADDTSEPSTESETTESETAGNIIDIEPIEPEKLPQFLGASVTPNAAKVAEIVAKIQNRASTMTKQSLSGIDGTYYVFAITTPEELMAVQVASETDTLEDCAFTLAKSKEEPDNVVSKNADLSAVVGFTGIAPNADYPFGGVFSAYIDNVNYKITCPLFTYLSTDAVVHNISLYSVQSASAVAAISNYLVKGEDESVNISNIHIKGAFGNGSLTKAVGSLFANVINHEAEKLIIDFDKFTKIYFEPDTISGNNKMPIVSGNYVVGGLVGYVEGNVEIIIGDSIVAEKLSISAGAASYTGRYVGYVKDGVAIKVVSNGATINMSSINGKNVGGIVGRVEGGDGALCKITVEDSASIILVGGGATGDKGVSDATGGFAGYVTKTELSIKNITCTSAKLYAHNSTGSTGILFGKIHNCTDATFDNITFSPTSSGAIALVSYIDGGVIGELIGDNFTFSNIKILGDIHFGNSETQIIGGIAARVSGTNIIVNDTLVEIRATNPGNFRGKYRGGLFGEIFNAVTGEYNSIKVNNYTATGLNGAADGGFANADVCQGTVAGKVCNNTLLCLDGTIDLSKIKNMGNNFKHMNSGLVIGLQEDALIYAEKDADILRMARANRAGSLDDIGTSGGIYINREINDAGELLINFDTPKNELMNCVHGEVTVDALGAYTFKDEADFIRMSIFMYTLGKFAANCFPAADSTTLLSSDIKVTADIIDLRNTGVYCLMQNGIGTNSAVETDAYSGTMSGVDAKTTIIMENVLSTQYNLGLFSCVSNATFKNLAIVAESNVDEEETGYKYVRNFGAIAPVAYNSLTLDNVDIGTRVKAFAGNYDIDTYYGGAVGYYNMKDGKLTVSDCNFYPTIMNIGYKTYAGGLAGQLLTNNTIKNSTSPYDITIKNVTVGTKLYTRQNYFPNNNNDIYGYFAGLIAIINVSKGAQNFTGDTYTKMAMQNIVIDGFVLDMTAITANAGSPYTCAGGMLGQVWRNVEIVVSKNAVDDTNTSDISLFAKSADIDTRMRIGGIISIVGGKALFKDIVIGEKNTTGKIDFNNLSNRSHMGMIIHEGKDAYILIDNYELNVKNDDSTQIINVTSNQPIDDIMGYNLNGSSSSYDNNLGGIVNIKDDGFKNGTSQGYVNKLNDYTYSNDWVRYYYNVLEFDDEYANNLLGTTIDNAYRLMILELLFYANSRLDRYVTEYMSAPLQGTYTISGDIDLKGHSFYPIQLQGARTFEGTNNATIIFPEEEYYDKFIENSVIDNRRRHYRLWGGLFVGPVNLNISNITFKGVVSDGVNGGFLIHGNTSGNANISNITFDGAYLNDYRENNHYVGLMIKAIYDNAVFNISGIRMINYNTGSASDKWITEKIAGALIGVVGNVNTKNTKIVFRDMKLDYLKQAEEAGKVTGLSDKISPFAHATFICSYNYTSNNAINQSYGVYYFTSDDYTAGNVTIGSELQESVEFMDDKNAGNASQYSSLENICSIVASTPGTYLPYVCTVDTVPTIFVNPKNGNLLQGCGTYADPYIISNARQLYSLFMYLAENTSYNQILDGWKVNDIGDQTQDTMCDSVTNGTDHTYYVYDGYNLNNNTDFPTKVELANAYYLITEDIDMSAVTDINMENLGYEFVGLGCANVPFTGVIVGRKSDGSEPTITVPIKNGNHYKINYGFIQYMNGGVLKDLIIKTVYEIGTGKGGTDKKLVISQNSAIAVSTVLGGDNIIDNVKIVGTICVSNIANDYIGGYVSVIQKGGVIFRNLTGEHMAGFNVANGINNAALNNTHYAYMVQTVRDGYILYEDTSGTPFKENEPIILKEHFDNPSSDTDNLDAYVLAPTFNLVNVSYLDTSASKILVSKTGTDIEVILADDRHLQILAMAMNSDALSVSGTNIAANITNNGYDRTTSTRKAMYDSLGSVGADCTEAVTYDNNGYKYPYLLHNYFEFGAGDSLANYYSTYVHTNGVEYVVSQFNKTATMEGITGFVTEYNTVYKLNSGAYCDMAAYGYSFRGIGAQYYKTYSRFNASFDGANATPGGDNATIKLGMDTAYDNNLNNIALFNEINTSTYVVGNLSQGQKDETAPFIKNIIVTGSVVNNSTSEGTKAFGATDAPRAAAVVAALYGSYVFENITLNGMSVAANGDVGGIVGRVMNQGVSKWYSVILRGCNVVASGSTYSDIASIRLTSSSNPHWEKLFDAGGLIGKVGSNTYYVNNQLEGTTPIFQGYIYVEDCKVDGLNVTADRGSAGGFIGSIKYINKTTIDIIGSTDDASYIRNTDVKISASSGAPNGPQHNGSAGGVLGEYYPVTRTQGNANATVHTYRMDNKLNINNIDVETVDISASNMTDRDMYNNIDCRGHYGLGGILGSATAYYVGAGNDITVNSCSVSDVNITDTSTLTFENGSSGGIIGFAGATRKNANGIVHVQPNYSYIDNLTITECDVNRVNIASTGVKNWAQGAAIGQTNVVTMVMDDIVVKDSSVDGISNVAGGLVGYVSGVALTNATRNDLIRDISIDNTKIYSKYDNVSNDRARSLRGVAGGIFGVCGGANYPLNMYNITVNNCEIASHYTGGIIGNTHTSTRSIMMYKIAVTNNKILGRMAGGVFGNTFNSNAQSYYDDIDITDNIICAYSDSNSTGAYAGGFMGYSENNSGYLSNIDVTNNVITSSAKPNYKAGGLIGGVQGGNTRIYAPVLKNNIIGFNDDITSYNKSMFEEIAGKDTFDNIDFTSEVKLANTSSGSYVYEDVATISKQKDILVYSFGTGIMVGGIASSTDVTILAADVIYDGSFVGCRPVVDVGVMDVFTATTGLNTPSATELSAILKYTNPTKNKRYVGVIYSKDSSGNEIKTYPDGTTGIDYGTYYPTKLEEFADNTTAFGTLDTILDKYKEVLDKEAAGTLTLEDVLSSYRLNIAYSGCINPSCTTIMQLIDKNISYRNLSDAVINMDGVDIPIIVADGQYTSAESLVHAVTDAMTNVSALGLSITKMESKKAKLTIDTGGDCVINYVSGVPTISISGSKITYKDFDTFGEENGVNYATISVVKITCGWQGNGTQYNYTKTVDANDAANTTFSVNPVRCFYIPIFVKERLQVNESFTICEGAVYNTEEIEDKGYSGEVVMAKDTTYTMLSEFHFGKSIAKDNYGTLFMEKKIILKNEDGTARSMDAGTLLTMIEVNTGEAYYYEVTGNETGGIDYTDFVDVDGNHYENRNMKWFNDNGLVKTDGSGELYGEEKFIIVVDLPEDSANAEYSIRISSEDTDDRLMQIEPSKPINIEAIPGLNIRFHNKKYSDTNLNENKTYIQGELTNTKKDSITIDMLTAIEAAVDPVTGFAGYWNYASGDNIIDSANNGKYLELAIYLQVQGATKRMSLPVGTKAVVYDDANPSGKEIDIAYGQSVIYYYKNSVNTYALDSVSEDTYKQHTVVLDFANTDLKDYTDNNYEIYVELIRTADPNYPMSSDKRDEYSRPVATAVTRDFAIATEVKDLITLGINTYRQREYIYDIPFISKIDFSDMIDFENGTPANIDVMCNLYSAKYYYISYRLYRKEKTNSGHEYVQIDDEHIKLYKEEKDGSGNIVTTEYESKIINGEFVYVDTYNFDASEIKNGTDNGVNTPVSGLVMRDMKLVVDTENIDDTDLTNYKLEMRLVPYDIGINEDTVTDEIAATSDYFIFTIAKLKTDM